MNKHSNNLAPLSAAALLACALAPAAQAQTSTVQIYGILDVSINHASARASKNALRTGDLVAPRLGFKGSEDLGGGLRLNFALEAAVNLDNGTGGASNSNNQSSGATPAAGLNFNRQSWVGLQGGWGELRLGRNFNPAYRQYIAYDPFNGGGTAVSQAAQSSLASYGHAPAGLRHSNAIEYWLPSKGALTGQFMVALGENSSGTSNRHDGDYYSGRLAYQLGDLNAGIGYGKSKELSSRDIDELVLGAKYKLGAAQLMAMYTHTENGLGLEQQGWLLGATYRVAAMEYRTSLSSSETENAQGRSIAGTRKLAAYAAYHLSKRSSVYTLWAFTNNKHGAAVAPLGSLSAAETGPNHSARSISLGVVHNF